MTASLTSLTSFILPGGTPPAAALHLARAIARRAERAAVTAAAAMPINHHALAYLNLLSDWLFVASLAMNKAGAEDVLWKPGATRLHGSHPISRRVSLDSPPPRHPPNPDPRRFPRPPTPTSNRL